MSLKECRLPTASALAIVAVAALVACGRAPEGKDKAVSNVAQSGAAPVAATTQAATPSSSASADPCTLLTKAEAESIFGAALGEPLAEHSDGSRRCTYKNDSNNVLVTGISDPPSSTAALEQFRGLIKGRSVSGVGDGAMEGPIGTITFVKGSTMYIIDAGIPRWGDEKLLGVAKAAAARL